MKNKKKMSDTIDVTNFKKKSFENFWPSRKSFISSRGKTQFNIYEYYYYFF